MSDYLKDSIETDFRKWLAFSESIKSSDMLNKLTRAINKKKSYKEITLKKEKQNDRITYFITEQDNSVILQLNDYQYPEFSGYFTEHYAQDISKNNTNFIKSPARNNNSRSLGIASNKNIITNYNYDEVKSLWAFLIKISSRNKLKHTLTYSLVALLVLQLVIILGNVGKVRLGDFGTYTMFALMLLFWYVNIWTYTKFYSMNNSYWEIFRLTAYYFSLVWLFSFLEVGIIDYFQGKFNVWFSLLLVFLGQVAAILISLFTTAITYFIRGGKVVTEE
ncbi:hypothetical protein [Marinoscillum sp. 108]|uniref:hypothetical protein n=1 Tax=Marinoscillum sp. 108 TaxID=2653151 RepID=UPI0013577285|nr:hypothetical protein [Marinoscillum sp. 108]